MNAAHDEILPADEETRAELFYTIAQRIGATPQNVEKDFWVWLNAYRLIFAPVERYKDATRLNGGCIGAQRTIQENDGISAATHWAR